MWVRFPPPAPNVSARGHRFPLVWVMEDRNALVCDSGVYWRPDRCRPGSDGLTGPSPQIPTLGVAAAPPPELTLTLPSVAVSRDNKRSSGYEWLYLPEVLIRETSGRSSAPSFHGARARGWAPDRLRLR